MKRKHRIITVFFTCFISCMAIRSIAQDDFPSSSIQDQSFQELNSRDDKPLIYEAPEGSRFVHVQGDSIQQPKARKGTKKSPADAKEKDALSFNFLYYIIQKYKFSDIVDQ